MTSHSSDARGFSLLEVLFATTILTVAVAGLGQLFALAARANVNARTTTYATLLAQQKMEQLRSLTWGFDALGLPLSDTSTDITCVPERAAVGSGLTPSPASGTLGTNVPGYCDFVDGAGISIGTGATPPD